MLGSVQVGPAWQVHCAALSASLTFAMFTRLLVQAFFLIAVAAATAQAQTPEPSPGGELVIPQAARPSAGFDVERATRAYLDTVASAERQKSDAYFEGTYWLRLWGFVYGLGVAALLLFGHVSARLRDRAERITRRPWVHSAVYAAGFIVLYALLSLPFDFYQGWYREHQYD